MSGGAISTFVAVYHYDDEALTAGYEPLPEGDVEPVTALVGLLLQRSPPEGLHSAIPAGTTSPSQAEAGDALVLEMSEPFWSGPPEDIRRRAAQVVFTMASLEEGKRITLLNGLVPGEVTDVNGEVLQQPLGRHDFRDLRPWIQVIQPVAGAVVGSDVPVRVLSRGGHALRVSVTDGSGATLLSERVRRDGGSVGPIPPDAPEELTITIGSRITGAVREVDVPVRFGL
ncbi:MAG: GerMN domain-containing protein [Actinomycetota bacterium]|nr:GerMN domain-containing protein [Actinomycetota bacterium]